MPSSRCSARRSVPRAWACRNGEGAGGGGDRGASWRAGACSSPRPRRGRRRLRTKWPRSWRTCRWRGLRSPTAPLRVPSRRPGGSAGPRARALSLLRGTGRGLVVASWAALAEHCGGPGLVSSGFELAAGESRDRASSCACLRTRGTRWRRSLTGQGRPHGGAASSMCFRRTVRRLSGWSSSATKWRVSARWTWSRSGARDGSSASTLGPGRDGDGAGARGRPGSRPEAGGGRRRGGAGPRTGALVAEGGRPEFEEAGVFSRCFSRQRDRPPRPAAWCSSTTQRRVRHRWSG